MKTNEFEQVKSLLVNYSFHNEKCLTTISVLHRQGTEIYSDKLLLKTAHLRGLIHTV